VLSVDIPGWKELQLQHLLLDFNGTLAKDGTLIEGVLPLLEQLSQQLDIHVLTADTHGSVHAQCNAPYFTIHVLGGGSQEKGKQTYLNQLGADRCVAVGNGRNDRLMLSDAALGIALLQTEGLAAGTLGASDLLFASITDTLEALLHPKRLIASLRDR
jgi:soluble P-type ATPase